MLKTIKDLHGYALRATDGEIGTVKDFYFDDDHWAVRYLVVETGSWLASRKVLISPVSLGSPDHAQRVLPVRITREQVKNSPDIDTDKPVSRQHEVDYLGYYGYPAYWDGVGLWGGGSMPAMMMPEMGYVTPVVSTDATGSIAADMAARHERDDPHLRSCESINGYHIKAQDGELGHVRDWILDDETWAIRYLVVDTGNWWMGHKALISPQWISEVSWEESVVAVKMTQQAVKNSPPWDPAAPPTREQEVGMYSHYDRTGYW